MKVKCFVIFVILVVELSLASAYTAEQQTIIDSMNLSFRLGRAYQMAQQNQNVAVFNSMVDQYNAWIRQHFGDDPYLLMSKISAPSYLETSQTLRGVKLSRPFNASSELGKFGKQQVFSEIPPRSRSEEYTEAVAADAILRNF